MDSLKRTRACRRDRQVPTSKVVPGDRQICLPMDVAFYTDCWEDPPKLREYIEQMIDRHPELFPAGIACGFRLTGRLPESKKLPGIRLRQLRLKSDKTAYTLRPSFVLPYMVGRLDETSQNIEGGLLLLSHNVPVWLVGDVLGHDDMYWERLLQRLGRNSLVGTTVNDPQKLPEHLAADEHHVKWRDEKGYVATTVGRDCILGLALTRMADDQHLQEAYGEFHKEAQAVNPQYAPQTVNTDGWAATQKSFRKLFPLIAVILCYLHGWLKIRDRCRKDFDLHRQVWEVYHAPTHEEFHTRMLGFQQSCQQAKYSPAVREKLEKLWKREAEYAVGYEHPGCHRTSNAVDRPMNAMHRQVYAGRGLHGHQHTSQRRLRGWALLYNFRPYAPRSGQKRDHVSRAHKLNERHYSKNWLENLLISASCGGRRLQT